MYKMDTDYSFVWVLLIALIGIAVSIYSLCKGCRGYTERGIGARALVAPYAGLLHQMRAEAARTANFFAISGNAVGDKNPPTYDELFAAPPPSYAESVRMLKGGFSLANNTNNNNDKESAQSDDKKESCAKENDSSQVQSTVELGQATSCSSMVTDHVTVLVQEENEVVKRHDSSQLTALVHTTPVVLDIETQKETASCEYGATNL